MSLQAELSQKITERFIDAIVKKVDKDNFLDIHIPSVNEKKGTHLFFNTGKGKIKMGFYCRDKNWVDALLQRDSNRGGGNNATLEGYSQGIRPVKNPEFESVDDAIACIGFKIIRSLCTKLKADLSIQSKEGAIIKLSIPNE